MKTTLESLHTSYFYPPFPPPSPASVLFKNSGPPFVLLFHLGPLQSLNILRSLRTISVSVIQKSSWLTTTNVSGWRRLPRAILEQVKTVCLVSEMNSCRQQGHSSGQLSYQNFLNSQLHNCVHSTWLHKAAPTVHVGRFPRHDSNSS